MKILVITDSLFVKFSFYCVAILILVKIKFNDGVGVLNVLAVNRFDYIFVLNGKIDPDLNAYYDFKHADVYFYRSENVNGFFENYDLEKIEADLGNHGNLFCKFAIILIRLRMFK